MIYILFLSLIIVFFIAYVINKKDIFAPACIFIGSFIFSAFWACLYANEWELQDMHINTFLVILLGCIDFLIFTVITSIIKNRKKTFINDNKLQIIKIQNFWKILILVICIITVLWTAISLLKFTGLRWNKIFDAINLYKEDNTFSNVEGLQFPKVLKGLRITVSALGYYFIYVSINNYLVKREIDFKNLLIVFLTMISSIESGGRSTLINQILVAIMIYVILLRKKNGKFRVIKFKQMIKIFLLGVIILLCFQKSLVLMGRKTYSTPVYYIAYYCGAEIKNLDLYLQNRYNSNNIVGSQTFINLIRWFGKKIGYENYYYTLDLPFRSVGNLNLGNVYTTFYAYIYDFGYFGEFILVALMAFMAQSFYIRANKKNNYMYVLIYAYMFSGISMSFFSNRFYEQIFNLNFVYFVILWYLMNYFLVKVKLKIK